MMQADRTCEKRMAELATRAARTGITQVAWFLSPAEQAQAEIAARQAGTSYFAWGGVADAERKVVAFADEGQEPEWPIACLHLVWHAKYGAPGHRDMLGSIMGLGISREKIGDIFIQEGQAYVFALKEMAGYIQANTSRVGNTPVRIDILEEWPQLAAGEGSEVRATVSSLRLDALLGAALHLSRGKAAELVAAGRVQVNHVLTMRQDMQIPQGAVISIRGMGRIKLASVGGLSKKGRICVQMLRY